MTCFSCRVNRFFGWDSILTAAHPRQNCCCVSNTPIRWLSFHPGEVCALHIIYLNILVSLRHRRLWGVGNHVGRSCDFCCEYRCVRKRKRIIQPMSGLLDSVDVHEITMSFIYWTLLGMNEGLNVGREDSEKSEERHLPFHSKVPLVSSRSDMFMSSFFPGSHIYEWILLWWLLVRSFLSRGRLVDVLWRTLDPRCGNVDTRAQQSTR